MDTLSGTTTTALYKLPTSTSRDLHHATTSHHNYNLSSSQKTTNSRRTSLTSSSSNSAVLLSTKSSVKPPSVAFHRRASSGYAAALLDAAQSGGSVSLSAIAKDVKRFSKVLRREEIRDFICDAAMMKLIAEKGRFHAQLKVLLNLLIQKGKLGILGEVLDEFERIYQVLDHGFGIGIGIAS